MHRQTAAHIDLGAIRANLRLARSLAPGCRALAVIKADAYGHGYERAAAALAGEADALAVATVDEALQLRAAGIGSELLVLQGAASPGAASACAAGGIATMLHSPAQLDAVAAAGGTVWVKVDTGMHRLGIEPAMLAAVLARLQQDGITVAAICTHLAAADEAGNAFTEQQLASFEACSRDSGLPRSAANSAGILAWPASHYDWIRPGIMLYGASPLPADEASVSLRPAMRFVAELIAIREIAAGESVGYGGRWTASRPSRIATVAAGYADGYPRHAPNGTPVGLRGQRAALVGAVSMDLITIDVTDIAAAAIGDAVELWGPNVAVNEVAALAGTIGYELLSGLTARVPRVYGD